MLSLQALTVDPRALVRVAHPNASHQSELLDTCDASQLH